MLTGDALASPLYYSVITGIDQANRILVNNQNYVNQSSVKYGTPLQGAAYSGSEEMIKMLMLKNVYPDLDSSVWGTPLELAIIQQHVGSVRLLPDAGANLDPKSEAILNEEKRRVFRRSHDIVGEVSGQYRPLQSPDIKK